VNRSNILINLSHASVVVVLLVVILLSFYPGGCATASAEILSSLAPVNTSGVKDDLHEKAELQAAEPPPKTIAECGSCHEREYENLQEFGGAHQFVCWECHQIYHAEVPESGEIMPLCTECHDAPHGDKQVACSNCHENAHTPLTISTQKLGESCSDCHQDQADQLRKMPSAHTEMGCGDCHQEQHGRVPSCTECHDAPHGDKQVACSNCHENAHAPLTISTQKLGESCSDCHQDQADQLRKMPSAHTEMGCGDCHQEQHGRVPSCSECHESHFPGQVQASCMECHPPHQPLSISFAADADAMTCADCHVEVFVKWSKTASRHGKVNCMVCHSSHGSIAACTDCHRPPHDPELIAKFKSCLGCHLDAHNLPSG